MGVMACSRMDCPNIMCDTYIGNVGYVCQECQKEFKTWLDSQGLFDNKGLMLKKLKDFMTTEKGMYDKTNSITVEEFFDEYTHKHKP